jgi:hypothetical protein
MTMIEVEPQPRIDTLVRLPAGGEARHTEYVGTVWFGGKPMVSGPMLHRAPGGIRMPGLQVAFFLPDSLPYERAALGTATLSVSVVLQGSGERSAIVGAGASFVDDPKGTPTWIQVGVHGHLGWPAGIGYRIVALTPPDAVR